MKTCENCKDMCNYEATFEDEPKECDNCENQTFVVTPKGIAIMALEMSGITDADDSRIDAFWTIFELMMEKHGYLKEE